MTKNIVFNLSKKNDEEFEIGRTSNEFIMLATLSVIVHLGR